MQASPPGVPRLDQARLDATTFAFAAALALVSSLLFGLVPAWRGAAGERTGAPADGPQRRPGASRDRLRSALVVAEVALALVLLVGSAC